MAKRQTIDAAATSGGSFGQRMLESFAIKGAPMLEARDLRFGPLAVFELRYDGYEYGESEPTPSQDALLVSIQLRASAHHRVAENGRLLPEVPLEVGMTCVHDLRGGLSARSLEPFHSVNFIIPMADMVEAQEERVSPPPLAAETRMAMKDPVFEALGRAVMPALAQPERAMRMFVDQVMFAMRSHVGASFNLRPRQIAPGGL
ncbi:MAG TPA: hypothetical protein VMF89_02035, partial [Polyangiales bacterium]|nr:hypothetical protein [Polyangiales bacterium]